MAFARPTSSATSMGIATFEKGVVVVGTDTGVGKTLVAAALVCALRTRGVPAIPMKPVQTGCSLDRRAPDLEFCLSAAGLSADDDLYSLMSPYRFLLPASPHLAARQEGVEVAPSIVLRSYEELRTRGFVPVVEAAGGLLVPLTDTVFQIDLLLQFKLPIVLVARTGLGTLNHTLLSVEALRARGAALAWVVLNNPTGPPGLIEDDNARTLERLLHPIVIRRVPHLPVVTPSAAENLFSASDTA